MEPNNQHNPTLKELRDRLEISQEQLARRIGSSYRSVAEWESGRKIPRFDNAVRLAEALGVSLADLAKAMNIDTNQLSKQ